MQRFTRHGRFLVAFVALTIAFVLSIQLGDRGVQFDLRQASLEASEGKEAYELSSLKILNRVLLQLKDNYVEPERIQPGKMLLASLDALQNNIAEIVVNYDREVEGLPANIEVRVGAESQRFDVRGIESLWEMSFRLKEIFLFIERHLPPDPDRKIEEVEYAAINGLLTTLDPHSNLLPPAHYEEMQTQTGGRFGGLGIVISIRDGHLTVISPIDGTPAAQKGIRAQDRIVRIGEESTINMNLNEAVNMLRGEPGTDVDLWIQRPNWPEPRQYTVTRAIIKIDSVDSRPLANKVGYVRIKNFQANTFTDLRTHLQNLRETMGGMQGIVLDMRDNPGGLLDQSIRISDLWLNEGTIVSTVGVGNKLRETKRASRAGTEPDYPIIVLVNGGSASASEIVSGALQNNNRAIVLGDTTFGKGTVQILYEFPDRSALKLTVAQYLTPGGVSIQSRGIVPDLNTIPVAIRDKRVDMFLSQHSPREGDLGSSLPNFTTRSDNGAVQYIRYLNPEALAEPDEETFVDPNEFVEDFEIKLAQQLLVAAGDEWRRSALLTKLQPELQKVYDRELEAIRGEFRKVGIDWSEGPSPQVANVDLEITSSSDGTARPGDVVSVTAKLTNKGREPLYRVKALSQSDNPALENQEFIFGRVNPGESKSWTIDITIPKDSASRHDRMVLAVSDAQRELDGNHTMDLRIAGNDRPHFAFAYEVLDASGDGVLQQGEEVTFRIFVENLGQVPSEDAIVYLRNHSRDAVYLHTGREKLGEIPVGEKRTVDFKFSMRNSPPNGNVELEIDVFDMAFREFVQKKVEIPFSSGARTVKSVKGSATVKTGPAKLFVAASAQADLVATAGAGARLPVSGEVDGWLRLDLGNRSAWIQKEMVDFQAGRTAELSGIDQTFQFQRPRVELTPNAMLTSNRSINLAAVIRDDWPIQDYYIVVHQQENRTRVNTHKVNYERSGAQKVDISADVPLFKGMNRISLVTRNDVGMSTTESVFVFRE